MKKIIRELPDYTPIAAEDLRLFPDGISWFIANIILMLIAFGFCTMMLAIKTLNIRPDIYVAFGFGVSLVITILCILVTRGHRFPIKYLRAMSLGLLALSLIAVVIFTGTRGNQLHWLSASMALVSYGIVSSPRYYRLAEFYQRAMERQLTTGLTRAEDIRIHYLLQSGNKEDYENARSIVINARERIKK